ncbi:MAG: hypothetical protein K2X66_09935, partial [Cyanobacteria bacterium]|nr:hypothetical protein [Cyanobacteriota bacterium]
HQLQGLLQKLKQGHRDPKLEKSDQKLLWAVGQFLQGVKTIPAQFTLSEGQELLLKNILSVSELNQAPFEVRQQVLHKLETALKVKLAASQYHPRSVSVGGKTYLVHNSWVHLKPQYTSQAVGKLLATLTEKGVFNTHTHPGTGLLRTSETENLTMMRQWFTDGSKNGLLQREKAPENWKKVVLIHAAAIQIPEAQEAIAQSVANSNWYRQGSLKHGVFHIFEPESVRFDPKTGAPVIEELKLDASWFNQKRIESQALILGDFIDTLRVGFLSDRPSSDGNLQAPPPWGYSPAFLKSGKPYELVKKSIVDLARYLVAIQTHPETGAYDFAAPSASSWEETPLPGGMTSDIADTVLAFEKLQDLLENPAYSQSKAIETLRRDLRSLFKMLPGGAIFNDPTQLKGFIDAGRAKIEERCVYPLAKGQKPQQNPHRHEDTSLTLLAASDYQFSSDPMRDAAIRFDILMAMKQTLQGDYGMRRYNEFEFAGVTLHDSYLNDSYHLLPALRAKGSPSGSSASLVEYGSKDASSVEAMKDRQSLSAPEHSAQWCLGVSATLQGLAKAKTTLLKSLAARNRPATPEEQKLLTQINGELVECINLNLALIAGRLNPNQPVLRSDGTVCPENSVMEAYEVVRDLDGNVKRLPGAHTLLWGASQLFDGLRKTQASLEMEERLKAKGLMI